jgi:hypothetical protein
MATEDPCLRVVAQALCPGVRGSTRYHGKGLHFFYSSCLAHVSSVTFIPHLSFPGPCRCVHRPGREASLLERMGSRKHKIVWYVCVHRDSMMEQFERFLLVASGDELSGSLAKAAHQVMPQTRLPPADYH